MSKAGGIAYLLKHGRAPFPVTTRTQQPRAKGVKRMAEGGLPNANAPLNYGTVPDYVFVPGGMEIDQNTGKPVWKSGRYELRSPSAAGAGAGAGTTSNVGVPRIGTSSDGGRDTPAPSGWDKMTDKEKAAYYNENPGMGKFTRGLQDFWSNTSLGKIAGWLQEKFDPGFTDAQRAQTFGLDRATFEAIVRDMGINGSNMNTPSVNEGMTEEQQRDEYSRGRASVPTGYAADGMGPPASAAGDGWSRSAESVAADAVSASGGMGQSISGDTSGMSSVYAAGGSVRNFATGGIAALAGGGQPQGPRLLSGGGDGLSDGIPAVIGKGQPARLADGEFVVSADVVSALGGGSTKAGAKKLYAMMDRIRQNAHGTKKQVKKVNERKVLPA